MAKKLFIPGPTEVREDILKAQAQPMIGHRSKDFAALYENIISKTKKALNTNNHVIVFTASGTGIMEGSIRNCVRKDVLCCVNGAFSERWYKIAKACGKEADIIKVDMGKAIKPEMIEEKLKNKKYDAVTLVHNESSTGVRAPSEQIADVIKKYPDTFWLMDSVSAMMGDKIEIDKWGVDVCLASSQKCFALPPGLAVCSVSPRALERTKTITDRGYYFDFDAMLKRYEKDHQTPSTPAITLMYAMDKQMDKILAEGIENRYQRHLDMANFIRNWAKKHFAMFPEPGYESVTLSCIDNTRKIKVADLNSELGKRGYQISNGYGDLKELTFRIAHMGDLTMDEMREITGQIEDILGLK